MKLTAFILNVLGAVLGVSGALIMAKPYFPGGALAGFVVRSGRILWKLLRRSPDLDSELRTYARAGAVNQENRGQSLLGLHLIFWSFLLQLAGTIVGYLAELS